MAEGPPTPAKDSARPVGVKVCKKVAKDIGDDWKWLGRAMEIDEDELDKIEKENISKGSEEITVKIINVWKKRRSKEATVAELANLLTEIDRPELADEILLIASQPKPEQKPTASQQVEEITEIPSPSVFPDEVLMKVSHQIGKDVKTLGRVLGIPEPRIDAIEMDEGRYGIQEFAYKVLITWRQSEDKPTEKKLAESLLKIGYVDTVKKIWPQFANLKVDGIKASNISRQVRENLPTEAAIQSNIFGDGAHIYAPIVGRDYVRVRRRIPTQQSHQNDQTSRNYVRKVEDTWSD